MADLPRYHKHKHAINIEARLTSVLSSLRQVTFHSVSSISLNNTDFMQNTTCKQIFEGNWEAEAKIAGT